jgi:DNA-binding beta-propeller fold protein YncE
MTLSRRVPLLAFALLLTLSAAAKDKVETIAIPGGEKGIGFDDLRYSKELGKLLVPAGRTGNLALVDPATHAVTVIGGFTSADDPAKGHSVGTTSADVGKGLIFAGDRSTLELVVADPASGKILGRTKLAATPDYVRYVESTNEVWVTEPEIEKIEVFRLEGNPPKPVPSTKINVPGGPESLVIERSRGHAYTNTFGGSTLAIGQKAHLIFNIWGNGCLGARGLAIDETKGFLFVACTEGKISTVYVLSGDIRGSAAAEPGLDIVDYDAERGHLYVPSGKSATLSIFGVDVDGKPSLLKSFPKAGGSCAATDSKGNVYVCDPKGGKLLVFKDDVPPGAKK